MCLFSFLCTRKTLTRQEGHVGDVGQTEGGNWLDRSLCLAQVAYAKGLSGGDSQGKSAYVFWIGCRKHPSFFLSPASVKKQCAACAPTGSLLRTEAFASPSHFLKTV